MVTDQGPQDPYQQQGQPQGQYPPPYPPQGQYPPPGHGAPRNPRHDEKQNEKEQEKQQEKGRGMDEKYHRNPLGFVTFAMLVIWLGVTLLLANAGVFGAEGTEARDSQQWATFLWGAGGLIILESLLRLAIPRFRRPVMGGFVWGAVGVGAGFGLWFGRWEFIGPIVIIAIGVAILASRLVPKR